MAEQFCQSTGIPSESVSEALAISTPMRKSVVLTRRYPSCLVLVGKMFLPVDLFVMPMTGVDVILGMNWLAEYCTILDCSARIVMFHIPGLLVFLFVVKPRGEPLSSFLASVVKDSVTGCIEQLPVVCEYLNMF
ncbi:uncharacterized protein LOC131224881 [Magnolia sinica]|uniref:uncharacterized protein LOC131224881 n=1 Tax=Magnolia sinica TaxID=86752 RepID=UPI002659D24F|nr:uncharacterized protein LOC131224881 [Magnolia sinica]